MHKGLMDIPNARSSHSVPTPTGGGLSFVLIPVIVVGILSLFGDQRCVDNLQQLIEIVSGGACIAFIGFWDDHQHIPARWRLLAHAVVVFGVVVLIGTPEFRIGDWILQSSWVNYLIFAIAVIWLLNLFNFMDGIDGLAGVEAIFVAFGAILLLFWNDTGASTIKWLGIIIAGVAGFLVWNWPAAKIFMGDVGSSFLGFLFGVTALITTQSGDLSIWSWVILLGVFIVDATVTLIRRFLRKERWYEAHRSHTYQRLARHWNSHLWVTVGVLLVNLIWLLPMAWCAEKWRDMGLIFTIISFIPLIYLTFISYGYESDSN